MRKIERSMRLRRKRFQTKWLTFCYDISLKGRTLKCQKSGKKLNPTISFKVEEIFVAQCDGEDNMRFARIKLSNSLEIISVGDIQL